VVSAPDRRRYDKNLRPAECLRRNASRSYSIEPTFKLRCIGRAFESQVHSRCCESGRGRSKRQKQTYAASPDDILAGSFTVRRSKTRVQAQHARARTHTREQYGTPAVVQFRACLGFIELASSSSLATSPNGQCKDGLVARARSERERGLLWYRT
jgi:hypothetical protein